jgi:hypothetical protein
MAIYDYPRIRFNTALNALEMNIGGEDWILLPTSGGSTSAPLSGSVTPSTNASTYFYAVSGNATLNGPSDPLTDGQKVTFRILNDASHTVALATGAGNFRFSTDIPGYTNSVSLTDYIGAIWNAGASRWDVVAIIQGF